MLNKKVLLNWRRPLYLSAYQEQDYIYACEQKKLENPM